MDDLISRSALIEHIKDLPTWWADDGGFYPGSMKYPEGMYYPEDIISSIENAPTIEAVPVVHGEWIAQDESRTKFMCSVCSGKNYGGHEKYCPGCGSKMDGVV